MKATAKNIQAIREAIEVRKERSAWGKGVQAYALDILASFDAWRDICEEWRTIYGADSCEDCPTLDERTALNGAKDWNEWAYGGSGLIYNEDIAERLCTKSELKRTHGGRRLPNEREHWLDVEARAARQAWRMIAEAVRKLEA